ncbi:unnamed protein product, partial [Rotaria sp. Silwood1]
MCHDRGYLVSQDELDQTLDQFKDTFARSHLNVLVAHNDDPTNTLVARFSDQEKIGVKEIKEYCKKMEDEHLTSTILIVQKGLTPMARDVVVNELENKKVQFQVFLESELLVNITEHN